MIYGNFDSKNSRYNTTETLDGGKFSNVPWVSALIEGKGRYKDPDNKGIMFYLNFIQLAPNWTEELASSLPIKQDTHV